MQNITTGASSEYLSNTNFGWDQERTSEYLKGFIGERLARLATIDLTEDE